MRNGGDYVLLDNNITGRPLKALPRLGLHLRAWREKYNLKIERIEIYMKGNF